ENVTILFRWAENQLDRLPELATDLVRRRVAVITSAAASSILAAKAATSTIPIVFVTGDGRHWPRYQPRAAKRQLDRHWFFHDRVGGKAAGTRARAASYGHACRGPRQSGQCGDNRGDTARGGACCSHNGPANPGFQR